MDNDEGTYTRHNSRSIAPVGGAAKILAAVLQLFGNMVLRQYERPPGDSDDPFIRTAGRPWRQLAPNFGGDVSPNNGEVAVFKLEDVRAALQPRGFHAAQMRVGTKSA